MVKLFIHRYNWTKAYCISQSVVDDLRQRIQQLEQAVLQVQQYIQLAHEEISREKEEMSAIQGHMSMLSKTLAALKRQMQTMGLWQWCQDYQCHYHNDGNDNDGRF